MTDTETNSPLPNELNVVFIETLKQAGAVFDSDLVTVKHFGNADDPTSAAGAVENEYFNAINNSSIFPLQSASILELTGEDRAKFLHNFCTADVKQLPINQGCEAFVTNVKGRVLGHIFVYNLGECLLVISLSPNGQELHDHLDRYLITEDVEIANATADYSTLLVTGIDSALQLNDSKVFSDEIPEETPGLQVYSSASNEQTPSVYGFEMLGLPGFLVISKQSQAVNAWQQLCDAGIFPAGERAFDLLRIEALLPLYGVDIDEGNLAQEVNRTPQAISFTKGCYLGQEPIARIDALGHVNRLLCSFVIEGNVVPPLGSKITDEAGSTELGQITTAEYGPMLQCVMALGFIKTSHTSDGTHVKIVSGELTWSATVGGTERP